MSRITASLAGCTVIALSALALCQQNPAFAPPAPASPAAVAPAAAEPDGELFEPAETAARVGDQYIFQGDLEGDANLMLALGTGTDFVSLTPQQQTLLQPQRQMFMDQMLTGAIERKLMYIEFLRTIPDGKMDEALKNINERIGETFSENLYKMLDRLNSMPKEEYSSIARQEARLFRLAYLMQSRQLTSLGQLEAALRANGSSLQKQQSAYAERALGQQTLRQAVDNDPEVTHDEILRYYQEHQVDFRVPARARWRQITLRFGNFDSKQQAGEKIAAIGNELALGGTPFWAVAKRESHGSKASEGGLHDWTERGDLEVSKEIDEAVFSLPLNELSPIIQDAEGLHIVVVLERTAAHMVEFGTAQLKIERALKNEKRSESIAKYVAQLRERTPVW